MAQFNFEPSKMVANLIVNIHTERRAAAAAAAAAAALDGTQHFVTRHVSTR